MEGIGPLAINQPVLKTQRNGHEFMYAVSNDHTAWRVKSMFTKEPDTIAWIEGMEKGQTFIDIGANMGIYTIFAAVRGLKVYAFEPEAQNYALLCRSIMFNDLPEVSAYCLALGDTQSFDHLYLSGYLPGGSCHTFGENLDHRLTQRENELKQGCMSVPLDQLNIAADHCKVDVDGLEHKVIAGGLETVKRLKSLLIEINQNLLEHKNLTNFLLDLGFRYDQKQVDAATRTSGTFTGCGNWIFYK